MSCRCFRKQLVDSESFWVQEPHRSHRPVFAHQHDTGAGQWTGRKAGSAMIAAGTMSQHTLTVIDHVRGIIRFQGTNINKSWPPCLPSFHSSYADRDDTLIF